MPDTHLDTIEILLIIIIPALISGVPAIVSAFNARKSKRQQDAMAKADEANAADKVTSAYDKLARDLQNRINIMDQRQLATDAKVDRQAKRIRHLEQGVFKLIMQVQSLGAIPVFVLPDDDDKEGSE